MTTAEDKSTLLRFKELYSQFPIGEITQPDKPDFIINGQTAIGIEVTQVFKDQDNFGGSIIRAKDTFRRNLLTNIVDILNSTDFPKCSIAVNLNDTSFNKSLSARTISKACIPKILSWQKNITKDGYFEFDNEGYLPPIIEGFTFGFHNEFKKTSYVETTGAFGEALTNKFIQYILDKKEKAKRQFTKCDTCWLLIKEGDFEGDYFGLLDVDNSQLRTTFDKVFLLRRRNDELVRLK